MTKIIPLIVVALAAIALWFAITSRSTTTNTAEKTASLQSSSLSTGDISGGTTASIADEDEEMPSDDAANGVQDALDDRPATEVYATADEAISAIKKAATSYDDLVLDQFTQPNANCQWCDQFYTSVKEMMTATDTKPDERSYYAEVLAVSGRVDNVKTLIDSVKSAKSPEEAETFSEALELTVGKDDVVKLLGETLSDSNTTLQEASVAALTNQGSRTAAEMLYNQAVKNGKEDGYYSLGIGLGELVPDEETVPFLQERAAKRDQYSHLAVKALLNSGVNGLRLVNDMVESGNNTAFDKSLLDGAKDHVAFDDDTVNYIKQQSTQAKNPDLRDFYGTLFKEYEQSDEENGSAPDIEEDVPEDEAPFTPLKPVE